MSILWKRVEECWNKTFQANKNMWTLFSWSTRWWIYNGWNNVCLGIVEVTKSPGSWLNHIALSVAYSYSCNWRFEFKSSKRVLTFPANGKILDIKFIWYLGQTTVPHRDSYNHSCIIIHSKCKLQQRSRKHVSWIKNLTLQYLTLDQNI